LPVQLFCGAQPLALGSVRRLRAQLAPGIAEDVTSTAIPDLVVTVGAQVNVGGTFGKLLRIECKR
jgi:hypothetical protein